MLSQHNTPQLEPPRGAGLPPRVVTACGPTPYPQRCEYTSKRCENPRAIKPNGEHHRLCDHHRRLANNNQRRWQSRKKLLQRADQAPADELLHLRTASRRSRSAPSYPYPPTALAAGSQPHADAAPDGHQEPRLVLPRLRQHHVLRHALSLPATVPAHSADVDASTLLASRFGAAPPQGDGEQSHYPYEHAVSLPASHLQW